MKTSREGDIEKLKKKKTNIKIIISYKLRSQEISKGYKEIASTEVSDMRKIFKKANKRNKLHDQQEEIAISKQ